MAKGKLVAARPTAAEEFEAYKPRLPWRVLLLGAVTIAGVLAFHSWNQRQKADRLRGDILRVYEGDLAEPAERYLAFRDKLERLILAAASKAPASYVDPRLKVSGLRAGRGLYLRLSLADAKSKKGIEQAKTTLEGDAIASCLGLSPTSARGIWEKGDFLLPSTLKKLRKTEGLMHLRVADEVLARHLRVDLPGLLGVLRSDWLLLVLQHGEDRMSKPVDVFLWDLKSDASLLRGRITSRGVLLATRTRSKDAPGSPRLSSADAQDGAAHDCSIASQIKELAGIPAPSVASSP